MKTKWMFYGQRMLNHPCINLGGPSGEKCISGEFGEIWENIGGKGYKAFVSLPSGNDKIYVFETTEEFIRLKSRIKVPRDVNKQLYFANRR
jgi:hypothetical protein